MRLPTPLALAVVAAASLACPAAGQNAISAKAGMVNIADGDVYMLDSKGGEPKRVQPKASEFISLKEGDVLQTKEGRTEVLLTPGSFLRMSDGSSFKLISNRLTDARVDVLSGAVIVEAVELPDDDHVTVLLKDATFTVAKAGIYRFEAEPARAQVYNGELVADYGGQKTVLKSSRELAATADGWTQAKFDAKETDALYRWAKRRSYYNALANVSAARQAAPYRNSFVSGSWLYNPYFGFATYVPYMDTLRNPFGYYYYTPTTVMMVYYAPNPAMAVRGGGQNAGGAMGEHERSAGSHSMTSIVRSSGGSGYSSSGISASSAPVSLPSSSSAGSGAGRASPGGRGR